jgi:hypothetical protein
MHRRVKTWHLRAARGFFGRPLLPFLVQLAVLGPLVLAPEPRLAAAGYLFFVPVLLPVFAVLSLPFVFAAFRAFRLDVATKRNHALEHATILELEARGGRRLAGRARPNGFRVSGHVSIDDVRRAFARVQEALRTRAPLACVTPRCGSNVVTAIGTGLFLLVVVSAWSVAFEPSWGVRAGALAGIVVLFAALRHVLGNALQRRFFLAEDVGEVSLRDVRHVPSGVFDRGPAIFVETIVRPRPPGAGGPTSPGGPRRP